MSRRRSISMTNLRLCFPDLDEFQREELLKANFQHLGMLLTESGMSWWSSRKQLEKLAHFSGENYLQAALQKGRGVILLTGHMTSLEIGGQLVALRYPLQVMYKKSRNVLAEAIILRGRERFTHRVFMHGDMRSMLKGLKENLVTWYAPDQDFGRDRSVFVDFMGIKTATINMTAKLAGRSKAPVIPYFPIRLPNDEGFEIRILPELENFPSGDETEDARIINATIEKIVQEYPEQYMWLHRRFKTRPEGEPEIYS